MATISRRSAAIDQILLVVVPFTVWLALSDRLFLGVLAARVPGVASPLVRVAVTAAVAIALIAAALAREVDPVRALGLGPMRVGAAIGWGLFATAASYVASSVVAIAYLAITRHRIEDELASKAEWSSRLTNIQVGWIVPLAVMVGLYEEVLFRGFLLGRLRFALSGGAIGARVETAIAVLVSSALFASGHAYQGGLGVAQTFTMGVVLSLVAVRCGAIWPCIVAHVFVDTLGLFVLHGLDPALARPP